MANRNHQHWALRAGDADREQVIDQLREHAAAGRLTMDEFEQRLDEVWSAQTYRDLHWTTRELPRLERRPRWAGLPIGWHLLADGAIAGGWLAVDPSLHTFMPVPALAVLASAAILTVQAKLNQRRLGRRGTWRVVAGDRWQIAARPPKQSRTQGPSMQQMLGNQWGWGWQWGGAERPPWPYPVPEPPEGERRSG